MLWPRCSCWWKNERPGKAFSMVFLPEVEEKSVCCVLAGLVECQCWTAVCVCSVSQDGNDSDSTYFHYRFLYFVLYPNSVFIHMNIYLSIYLFLHNSNISCFIPNLINYDVLKKCMSKNQDCHNLYTFLILISTSSWFQPCSCENVWVLFGCLGVTALR